MDLFEWSETSAPVQPAEPVDCDHLPLSQRYFKDQRLLSCGRCGKLLRDLKLDRKERGH